MFNHHRGLWGYSGRARDGAPLTIQSTGMGGPSAAIVVEELIALGARTARPDRHLRRARRRASSSATLAAGRGRRWRRTAPAGRSARTARVQADPARGRGARRRAGSAPVTAVSTDLFYDAREGVHESWMAAGARVVEMEAAAVLQAARRATGRRGAAASLAVTRPAHAASASAADRSRQRARRLGRSRARRGGVARRSRPLGRLARRGVRDRQALLRPRRQLVAGSDGLAQAARSRASSSRRASSRSASSAISPRPGLPARGRDPVVEPVERVLDPLEALRDRPQPPGEPLDVGRRRDPEGAHRGLLGLDGLLARLERARERGVHTGFATSSSASLPRASSPWRERRSLMPSSCGSATRRTVPDRTRSMPDLKSQVEGYGGADELTRLASGQARVQVECPVDVCFPQEEEWVRRKNHQGWLRTVPRCAPEFTR